MAILGIDEVGRGPWAGPLVVGACVLNSRFDEKENEIEAETWQDELNDSKKLTAKKREKIAPTIKEKAKVTGLGWVSAKELDEIGLAEALKLATRRAVEKIPREAFSEIIIDGTSNFLKGTDLENLVSVLPKADAKIKEVSAASIIAKVARDNYMKDIAEKYPGYAFEKHVGYGTAAHKKALQELGPCLEHRHSFKPVQKEKPIHLQNGSRAEAIVAEYLRSRGHTILARNHKTKFYEIDIVSATKDHIYFTEVKYRKNNSHGDPLEFIDRNKQQQITFAANSFMQYLSKKLNREIEGLPSPILAAASVSGPDFKLDKWLELVV
ncbi:ribonuclease HII [Candidatus Saccharibacteria bacterium]|nr:ribonuclease HII [Candidatus Saccharibacteria bacterium]